MRLGRRAALELALAAVLPPAALAAPEPAGYRMGHYHAPTPHTLRGGRVVTTAQAARLWRDKRAAFIDVLPQAPRPSLAPGTIWHRAPHRNIPGSLWLPDTGYGALAPRTLAYFKRGLAQAKQGDQHRLLVFYCKPECWMSWNAAKRALSLGDAPVAWYPGGAEAWHKAGLPLAVTTPVPRRR
ncbi:MAG: PQQ-dependent catabolism-associated CXXCW motif protein [Acetobacteraceae bacterium]